MTSKIPYIGGGLGGPTAAISTYLSIDSAAKATCNILEYLSMSMRGILNTPPDVLTYQLRGLEEATQQVFTTFAIPISAVAGAVTLLGLYFMLKKVYK